MVAQMAKYPFRWKVPVKCPIFWNSIFKKLSFNEKLNLAKIELLEKNYMELEFHVGFLFIYFLSVIAYDSIF